MNYVLESLNEIDLIKQETQYDTLNTLCNIIEKYDTISEHFGFDPERTDVFFQEGEIMDQVHEWEKDDKSKIAKVLLFIPRLVGAFFKALINRVTGITLNAQQVETQMKVADEATAEEINKKTHWWKNKTFKTIRRVGGTILFVISIPSIIKSIKEAVSMKRNAKTMEEKMTKLKEIDEAVGKLKGKDLILAWVVPEYNKPRKVPFYPVFSTTFMPPNTDIKNVTPVIDAWMNWHDSQIKIIKGYIPEFKKCKTFSELLDISNKCKIAMLDDESFLGNYFQLRDKSDEHDVPAVEVKDFQKFIYGKIKPGDFHKNKTFWNEKKTELEDSIKNLVESIDFKQVFPEGFSKNKAQNRTFASTVTTMQNNMNKKVDPSATPTKLKTDQERFDYVINTLILKPMIDIVAINFNIMATLVFNTMKGFDEYFNASKKVILNRQGAELSKDADENKRLAEDSETAKSMTDEIEKNVDARYTQQNTT